MKNVFLITTYNIANLHISLASISRYVEDDRGKHDFVVVINNDNPDYKLTECYVRMWLRPDIPVYIRNTEENQGCLRARLSALDFVHSLTSPSWKVNRFMFVDDDDVVLSPDFEGKALTNSHRAVVVHRLLEVLSLIDCPTVNLKNPHIEYEEWKMGCVGIPYKFEEYFNFRKTLQGFLPQVYEFYGSDKIFEPDDVLLMNWWNAYLRKYYGESWMSTFEEKDRFSYALTYLEDRKGRYEIPSENKILDLRYGGEWDGKTTYASIVNPLLAKFEAYLARL